MITIKYINGNNDSEIVMAAERFVRERRDDGNTQYLAYDGPKIKPDGSLEDPARDYVATWCGKETHSNGSLYAHRIYIMNEKGSTVAVYAFTDPDFSLPEAA